MKLLLSCMLICISASSIATNLFGDVELKDMSGRITATDWVNLIEQIRNQLFLPATIQKFKTELSKDNNFIEFPKKAAVYDFSQIGIELNGAERAALKQVMQTFTMHAAYEHAEKAVARANQWKETQSDLYKYLWSQLADKVTAPAAE